MISAFTKPRLLVSLAGFILSIHAALTAYVNSSYLAEMCLCTIPEDFIGLIYALGSILALACITTLPRILQRIGNWSATVFSLVVLLSMLSIIIFSTSPMLIAIAFVIYLATGIIIFYNLDIFLEHFSVDAKTGNIRGTYLTFLNLAWVLAPFISGQLIDHPTGFKLVYGVGAVMVSLALYIVLTKLHVFKDPKYKAQAILITLPHFWKNTALRKVFIAQFLLEFFFAWMVIYLPLYLNVTLGFSWSTIGSIFFMMLLPFVLFQIPLGRIADRWHLEPHIMSIGFLIMAICTGILVSVGFASWWVLGIILFGTRVGASAVQVSTESYFFKHIHSGNISEIGIFRDTIPIAYTLAPIIATILLTTTGLETLHLFLILGIFMLCGLIPSLTLVRKRPSDQTLPSHSR